MVRRDLLRGFDPEPLRQYRGQGLELHVAEPGERRDALAQIVAVRRVRPDAFGLTAVLVDHDRGELLDTLGHRAWETMNRRLLAKHPLELTGIGRSELARVERSEALLELERPEERRWHRHLLVEREADQQCERLLGEQRVCLVVA